MPLVNRTSVRLHFAAVVCCCALTTGCTTQDFEYAGRNKDVFRVTVQDLGNAPITFTPQVTFTYLRKRDSLAFAHNQIIAPDDPEKLIIESNEGTYGVSANVFLKTHKSKIKLTLIKGAGKGDNFVREKVIDSKTGKFNLGIRFGEN